MTSTGSMNDYINKAVKRYSSLFTLPSHRTILMELFVLCVFNGVLIGVVTRFSSPYSLALGPMLGMTLFAATVIADYLIHLVSVKSDPILSLRRCSALSLYSLLVWLSLTVVGVIVNAFYPNVWFKFFLLGFSAALALRLLVFSTISFARIEKVVVFAILPPALYVVPVVYTMSTVNAFSFDQPLLVFFLLSIAVTVVAILSFMFSLNRVGRQIIGVNSLSVLRVFIATWTENLNTPFERLFERFSQERDIQLSVLSFRNAKEQIKALMMVPAFHPGPFKNLGSSELPHRIQNALEAKLGNNCIVAVPHGLSGHDLDLATQAQNELVLQRVLNLNEISDFDRRATPFIRTKRDGASVSCQVFGKCVFVTLTLAPETMEDLPPELNSVILHASKKNGFSTVIAVDAHNSIQGQFRIEEAIKPLEKAVTDCLERASEKQLSSFRVGAAKVTPKEFSVEHGMGPGGIVALAVKVEDQTTAYITIDGNNMISGLREKILSALSELGVDEGEVFTTDTHAVNAVVLDARGYHPVGEAMDHELLIKYIKQATTEALNTLEPAEVGWRSDTVMGVKVIGEKQIQSLCMLVDKASRRAKTLAMSILPIVGFIFAALLVLL